MLKRSIFFFGLTLTSLSAIAQAPEQSRSLSKDYSSQFLEQALSTLIAATVINTGNQVEYKAGQSVVLQPGFEAKTGSVFLAHTGTVLPVTVTESKQNALFVDVYPNPFEQNTTISYIVTKSDRTSLSILDIEGRLVRQLVDSQYQEAGSYVIEWQADPIVAGIYICVLETGGRRLSKRILRR